MIPNPNPTIFLSYSWANKDVADQIDDDFQNLDITFRRDVRDAKYRTSIKEFMHQIGDSDFVLMIISDEYLRSDNCMYEVLELLNTHKFEQRILPIILDNATVIFKPLTQEPYYNYWADKRAEAKEYNMRRTNEVTLEYFRKCTKIEESLPLFFQKVSDINSLNFKKLKDENYQSLLDVLGFKEQRLIHRSLNHVLSKYFNAMSTLLDRIQRDSRDGHYNEGAFVAARTVSDLINVHITKVSAMETFGEPSGSVVADHSSGVLKELFLALLETPYLARTLTSIEEINFYCGDFTFKCNDTILNVIIPELFINIRRAIGDAEGEKRVSITKNGNTLVFRNSYNPMFNLPLGVSKPLGGLWMCDRILEQLNLRQLMTRATEAGEFEVSLFLPE